MLALAIPLQARLAALPELTGWDVRVSTDAADRRPLPAADVRCIGASVTDRKTGAAMVAPEWAVTLMVRRAPGAADLLDAALSSAICSLHGWAPGQVGERGWEPLGLSRVQEPTFADEGVVGYELSFSTAARYLGQT